MYRILVCLYILLPKWARIQWRWQKMDKMSFLVSPITWQMLIMGLPVKNRDLIPTPASRTDMGPWDNTNFPLSKTWEKDFILPPLRKRHQGRNADFLVGTEASFQNMQRKRQVWGCQIPDFRVHSVTAYKCLWCVFGTTCYPRLIICSQIVESVWKPFLL